MAKSSKKKVKALSAEAAKLRLKNEKDSLGWSGRGSHYPGRDFDESKAIRVGKHADPRLRGTRTEEVAMGRVMKKKAGTGAQSAASRKKVAELKQGYPLKGKGTVHKPPKTQGRSGIARKYRGKKQ